MLQFDIWKNTKLNEKLVKRGVRDQYTGNKLITLRIADK